MEEPVLLALIDQYLMGSIRPEDKADLERMMASDPEIAELVKESREAFEVLQSERNRLLREKLRELDRNATRRSGFLSKWIVLVLLSLVVAGGCWYWATYYFSNKAIAVRYFKVPFDPEEELLLSGDSKAIWEEANEAFNSEDYGRAFNLYQSFLDKGDHAVAFHARWNILLTDLAIHGPTESWRKALASFAWEAPAPFGSRAQELSRFLNSIRYKVIASCTQTNIAGLKPRFI